MIINESKWVQVKLKAKDDYKYCGNGGRSWVQRDSKAIDTWSSKEDAIKDGKENYKSGFKFGRDWDVEELKESLSAKDFKGNGHDQKVKIKKTGKIYTVDSVVDDDYSKGVKVITRPGSYPEFFTFDEVELVESINEYMTTVTYKLHEINNRVKSDLDILAKTFDCKYKLDNDKITITGDSSNISMFKDDLKELKYFRSVVDESVNEALLNIKKGDIITGGRSGKSYKVLDTDDGQGNVVVLDLEGKGKTYLQKHMITTKEFYKESLNTNESVSFNESKSYSQKEFSLSTSDLKRMKVGSEIHAYNKHARKIGPDQWELDDRIDTIKLSSSKIEDVFEYEEDVDILEEGINLNEYEIVNIGWAKEPIDKVLKMLKHDNYKLYTGNGLRGTTYYIGHKKDDPYGMAIDKSTFDKLNKVTNNKYLIESNNINESKSVKLSRSEVAAIDVAVSSDARAGIVEARDVQKALDKVYGTGGTVTFSNSDLEFLEYWNDLLINHPNSPKVKYMDPDLKSALGKIFN